MKLRHFLSALAISASVTAIAAGAEAKSTPGTQDFVQKASEANAFEIDSSKLALEKSQNDDVKQFAQQMIDDHTKAGEGLKATLDASHLDESLAGDKLNPAHKKIMHQLKAANDGDFDTRYIAAQTDAHKEAVALFGSYAKNGDDAGVKDFAGKTLPTLKEHLSHVKELKGNS